MNKSPSTVQMSKSTKQTQSEYQQTNPLSIFYAVNQ